MKKETSTEFKEGNEINTAVDIVIFNGKGEVLLGKRLAKAGFGTWGFPGGHLRTNEKIEECAQREIHEELGDEANIEVGNEILAVRENLIDPHFIHHLTVIIKGHYVGGDIRVNEPDRCEKWSWFKLDELPSKLFSGVRETLMNYKQQKTRVVTDWR